MFAIYLQRQIGAQTIGDVGIASIPKVKMNYKRAHNILGHKGIKKTKLEAQYFNWELKDNNMICEAYSIGKLTYHKCHLRSH